MKVDLRFARNVILKAGALFIIANLLFSLFYPMPALGGVSIYNRLIPGRLRLPYSDNPSQAYSLSLFNLDAMFASHEISAGAKPAGEFRVILVGDSSTWGFLLPAQETLAAQLNAVAAANHASDQQARLAGKRLRFYNLGYPVMSLAKDLLILSYAQKFQPDLVVWLTTLESFPYDKQLFPPLLQNNPAPLARLIETYQLKLDPHDPSLVWPGFWRRTLLGARRPLADLLRLQLYGAMWAATGIDQYLPQSYSPPQKDLASDLSFHNLPPPHLTQSDLAFDVLAAGIHLVQPTPLLVINEPMFISQGQNSQIRYNFYYPRWAYDDFRQLLAEQCSLKGWNCRDLWDSIPAEQFTNSAVHLSSTGNQKLAKLVWQAILETLSGSN
jgi:hypothetical protein